MRVRDPFVVCVLSNLGLRRVSGALVAVALAAALSWQGGTVAPATAQEVVGFSPFSNLSDPYKPPSDARFRGIHDRLKQRLVLEQLAQFLRPLRLPKPLLAETAQCGSQTKPYKAGAPITICYELIEQIEQHARRAAPKDTGVQNLIITGGVIQAVLHQTAIAVLETLALPVWGREEDAADNLAALTMVEFGEDMARLSILATMDLFVTSHNAGRPWTGSDFASKESPAAQRYYNYICIASAADSNPWPPSIRQIVEKRLPESRAKRCEREYEKVRRAFYLGIMPYVDPAELIKVKATNWVNWKPGK
jgi:hypothetical protein